MEKEEAYNNLVAVARDTQDPFYIDWVSSLSLKDDKELKSNLLSLRLLNLIALMVLVISKQFLIISLNL